MSVAVVSRSDAQSGLDYSNDLKRGVARGANKHLQLVDSKLKSLNLELVNTKHSIIKNVLKSRAIEKSQQHMSAAQDALRMRVLQLSHPDLQAALQAKQLAVAKDFSVALNTRQLTQILSLCQAVGAGSAQVLMDVLLAYRPDGLVATLNAYPANSISKELFMQIARACSSGFISDHEAVRMHDLTVASCPDPAVLWGRLKRRLLRKLLSIYVTSEGVRHLMEQEAVLRSHFKFPVAPAAAKGKALLSRSLNDTDLSSVSVLSSSSSQGRRKSLRRLDALTAGPSSSAAANTNTTANPYAALRNELNRSQQKQQMISTQIASNLAAFYANAPRSAAPIAASAGMASYFKTTAAKKIAAVMVPAIEKVVASRFARWAMVRRVLSVEKDVDRVSKAVAAVRLLRCMEWSIIARLARRLQVWQTWVRFYESAEQESAAMEIQRSFRGYQSRQQVKTLVGKRAALSIQNTFRVHIAKKFARRAMKKRLIRISVRRIEKVWMAFRWRRTLKKVFQYQRQSRSALSIQRIYRGHRGRRKYHLRLLHRLQLQAVVKFQSLYRRYLAAVAVDGRRTARKRMRAATAIQRCSRGHLARNIWKVRWRRHLMAKVIQYGWLCGKARKEFWRRKRRHAAITIQRVVRGRFGRKRFTAILLQTIAIATARKAARDAALQTIAPVGLGYVIRRRWKAPLQAHLSKRQAAARKMQCVLMACLLGLRARRRVKMIREDMADFLRRNKATTQIQRIARGVMGRKRCQSIKLELSRIVDEGERWPVYYKLKRSYYKSQDMYHRRKVVRIQALVRKFLAKKVIVVKRKDRSARTIQSFLVSRKMIAEAKSIKEELYSRKYVHVIKVKEIQKLVRGYLVRNRLRKKRALKVILWVAKERVIRIHIDEAINNFRIRKMIEEERKEAATQIQSLIRCFLGKRRYKKSYKSLQRQRAIRVRAKRINAALIVQCAFRCYRARMRVVKQRLLFAERERERREVELLEQSIDGIHEHFMTELLVIRAQTGVRGMLARAEFVEKVRKFRVEQDKQEDMKRIQAARKLQSRLRGVLGRRKFKKMLPALKLARRMRSLCVECETKPAVRRCRQCKDQYCEDCYEILHQKGKRKGHTWAAVIPDARALGMAFESRDPPRGSSTAAADKKKPKKGEWEEFFDAQAKAKYWFNQATGEASWVNPYL